MKKVFIPLAALKYENIVEDGVLDPLRVSDLYRRNACYPHERILAQAISETLYDIGATMTNLGITKPLISQNHKGNVEQMIAIRMADLLTRAKMAGASSILFPVHRDFPMGKKIRGIMDEYKLDSDFNFTFRTRLYDLNLSGHGLIDMSITRNALYKNGLSTVIGLWEISDCLKDKWSDELATIHRPA